MITLPSQIDDNKNNIAVKPIVIIDFIDLAYHIANREIWLESIDSSNDGVTSGTTFTSASASFITSGIGVGDRIFIATFLTYYEIASIVSETELTVTSSFAANSSSLLWKVDKYCNDKIKKNSNILSSSSIPELMNQVGSVGNITLQLVDYRETLRSSIIGTSPDLTNSRVNIYVKLDIDGVHNFGNCIQIAKGTISAYSIESDIMRINIKGLLPGLNRVPELLATEESISKPIHYGNFNYGIPGHLFGNQGQHYILAPLVIWDADAGLAKYQIAGHEMADLPDFSTDVSDINEGQTTKIFCVRDKRLVHLDGNNSGNTLVNNSSEAYVLLNIATDVDAYLWLRFLEEGDLNDCADFAYAMDGLLSTEALIDNSNPFLELKTTNAGELSENQLQGGSSGIFLQVKFGTITGTNSFRTVISDGVDTANNNISSTNSNNYVTYTVHANCNSFTEIDNWTFGIEQVTAGQICNVEQMWLIVVVQPFDSSDRYLYMSGRGRMAGSTWGGRKGAAGLVLEYAPEVIESLLRHEWGFGDDDFDGDSFDEVTAFMTSTKFILTAGSIWNQQDAYSLLDEICKIHNLCLFYSLADNKWKLFYPHKDVKEFAVSGTSTPAAGDIFTDTDTISSGAFVNHPIKKGTFKLKRSSESQRYKKLIINALRNHEGYTTQVETGSGKEIILNNWLLKGDLETTRSRNLLDDWLLTQKYIASFTTGFSAIGHEIGDEINIRHNDLNDDMLNMTVNTQKWIIIDIGFKWKPLGIEIEAIELF